MQMVVNSIDNTKDNLTARLIVLQIIIVLCFLFLIDIIGLPPLISYLTDIIWITLLAAVLITSQNTAFLNIYKYWILLYLVYALITLIINQQPFVLFLWGVRNNFRFYVFFLACAMYLRKENIRFIMKIMMLFYYLNIGLCLFQYFILNIRGDYLGGIFGTRTGCSAYMNLFIVMICTYQILRYVYHKAGIIKCLSIITCGAVLAALAELKIFYVELIVITAAAILFTRFTWRKLALVAGCICLVFIAVNLLYSLFPQWNGFFMFQSIYHVITDPNGYTGIGDLNRLSAVKSITGLFFKDNLIRQFTGLGLGSCEYSTNFSFLRSHFYSIYHGLHYMWLSNAWIYLETGYIGLAFFNGFFILGLFRGFRSKPEDPEALIYINMSRILSVCSIIMAIYNVSLRVECGYLMYFALAVPLVFNKDPAIATAKKSAAPGGVKITAPGGAS